MEQTRKKNRIFYILNISIPLAIGALIYFIFRPDTYIAYYLRNLMELPTMTLGSGGLLKFFRNYSCDILWSYSLMFAIFTVGNKSAKRLILTTALCAVFEILIEICQHIGFINGTFDIFDLLAEIIATIVALIIIKKRIEREWKNEKENI